MGKTTIAAELAYQMARERPEFAIFWVDASSAASIEEAYRNIWVALGEPQGPLRDPMLALVYFLNWGLHHQWLMILDGINTQSLQNMVLKSWIPSGLRGSLLLTTRNAAWLRILGPGAVTIQMPSLTKHWDIPRSPSRLFTGRTSIMKKIINAITAIQSGVSRRFVLTGASGQGKSEICLQVASQLRQR